MAFALGQLLAKNSGGNLTCCPNGDVRVYASDVALSADGINLSGTLLASGSTDSVGNYAVEFTAGTDTYYVAARCGACSRWNVQPAVVSRSNPDLVYVVGADRNEDGGFTLNFNNGTQSEVDPAAANEVVNVDVTNNNDGTFTVDDVTLSVTSLIEDADDGCLMKADPALLSLSGSSVMVIGDSWNSRPWYNSALAAAIPLSSLAGAAVFSGATSGAILAAENAPRVVGATSQAAWGQQVDSVNPTIVFVTAGTNDYFGNNTSSDYGETVGLLVKAIQDRAPLARVILVIPSETEDSTLPIQSEPFSAFVSAAKLAHSDYIDLGTVIPPYVTGQADGNPFYENNAHLDASAAPLVTQAATELLARTSLMDSCSRVVMNDLGDGILRLRTLNKDGLVVDDQRLCRYCTKYITNNDGSIALQVIDPNDGSVVQEVTLNSGEQIVDPNEGYIPTTFTSQKIATDFRPEVLYTGADYYWTGPDGSRITALDGVLEPTIDTTGETAPFTYTFWNRQGEGNVTKTLARGQDLVEPIGLHPDNLVSVVHIDMGANPNLAGNANVYHGALALDIFDYSDGPLTVDLASISPTNMPVLAELYGANGTGTSGNINVMVGSTTLDVFNLYSDNAAGRLTGVTGDPGVFSTISTLRFLAIQYTSVAGDVDPLTALVQPGINTGLRTLWVEGNAGVTGTASNFQQDVNMNSVRFAGTGVA